MPLAALDASDPESFPYWQRNMRSLAVGTFCNTMGFTVSFPYLALIVQELGVSGNLETWVGVIVGGFFSISFLLAPVWGAFADHFGRKSMVLRAGLGMGIGFCLMAYAPSMAWFLPFFVLVGSCNGYVPAAIALVATNTPRRHMGRALGTVQSGALLGTTAGPALGAVLATTLPSYQAMFWVSSAMSLTAGSVALLFAREQPETQQGPFRLHLVRDTAEILRVPSVWVLLLVMFLFATTMFGSTTVVALYVLELMPRPTPPGNLSLEAWVGIATVALTVSSALAAPFWGRGLDRFDPRPVLALSLAMAMLASWVFPFVQSPLQFTVGRVGLGLTAVGIQTATVHLIKSWSPPGMDARSLALATALAMLGNGAAPFLAGMIGPWLGLRAYFAVIALLLAVGLLLWVLRGMRRSAGVPA